MLVQASMGAIRTRRSYFHAKHNALRFRLGSYNKATVAIANHLSRAVYHLLQDPKARYQDLGALRADPKEQQVKRLIRKLEALGVDVDFHTHQTIMQAEVKRRVRTQI